MDNTDNHIYYDISIFNNDTTGDMPVNLSFNEMRSGGSLIDIPENYFFSIVRFELDSASNFPVFIPQALSGSLNDLIYTFVIETVQKDNAGNELNTSIYKRRVVYTPTNPNIRTPNPAKENFSDEYYYINNFQRWMDMVNTCLKAIHSTIGAEIDGLNIQPPFIQYDSSSGKVFLYTSQYYVDGFANTLQLNLYWNSPTDTIFNGFDTTKIPKAQAQIFDAQAPIQGGSHISSFYKVNIRNEGNINLKYFGITGALRAWVLTQQAYASLSMCSPIQNIVFTTSGNLPIANSQQASPVVFTSAGDCAIQGGADNISPILTDFIVPLTRGDEYKPKINYSPSVYRLIDLKGNAPLKNCDLQVYWKSKIDCKLHPLVLGSQCGASCKIMFRKKQFDNIF